MKPVTTYYRFQFYVGLASAITVILDQLNSVIQLTVAGTSIPVVSILLLLVAGAIIAHACYKIKQREKQRRKVTASR